VPERQGGNVLWQTHWQAYTVPQGCIKFTDGLLSRPICDALMSAIIFWESVDTTYS